MYCIEKFLLILLLSWKIFFDYESAHTIGNLAYSVAE